MPVNPGASYNLHMRKKVRRYDLKPTRLRIHQTPAWPAAPRVGEFVRSMYSQAVDFNYGDKVTVASVLNYG